MKARLFTLAAGLYFEGPARRSSLEELAARLAAEGKRVERRLADARDEPANHERLARIIARERWAQSRLRVALGDADERDDPERYQPDPSLSWRRLRVLFRTTRQQSVQLAGELAARGIAPTFRIPHSRYGEMSLRGWLRYIRLHASRESRGLRAR